MKYEYDLFVIGAGSGGVRAARTAAAAGKKVAIAEEKQLGGTCVNVGCIPKKLLVYAAHISHEIKDAYGLGWDISEHSFNWKRLIENKNNEIKRLNENYKTLLEKPGVTIEYGRARITSEHSVEVNGKTITAEKILITVGATPSIPDFPGAEHVISSDQIFFLPELPKKIVIVGGGYIAVEFAGIMNGFGVETHLVYRGEHLLKKFDKKSVDFAVERMKKNGVHIHFSTNITSIVKENNGNNDFTCHFDNNSSLTVDQVMYATGRRSLTHDMGLEEVGIDTRDNASIVVDDHFQTSIPSIFALGDVIGTPELTPVAIAQAMVFINQQYEDDTKLMNYENIATTVFSEPNIATVGLSEEQAREKILSVEVYETQFRHIKYRLSDEVQFILLRLLVEKSSQKVIGLHYVGPDAGELVQGFAVAVKAGLTKSQFDDTVGIHPTAAEEFVTMGTVAYTI